MAGRVFPRVQDVLQLPLAQPVRVEDVAELLAVEALQLGVVGVQFRAQHRTAILDVHLPQSAQSLRQA